jgi:hypothetical protein
MKWCIGITSRCCKDEKGPNETHGVSSFGLQRRKGEAEKKQSNRKGAKIEKEGVALPSI